MLVEHDSEARTHCLLVAGRRLMLRFPCPTSPADALPDAYLPFRCSPEAGLPLFELALGDDVEQPQAQPTYASTGQAIAYRIYRGEAGGYVVGLADRGSQREAWLRADSSWSRLQTSLLPRCAADKRLLDFMLMRAFGFAAPRSGALLMHASVVARGGRAMLFLGASGTGKSTHSGLWLSHVAGAELVNDDNPVVALCPDGGATVSGSPWSGKTPCYRQLTLPVCAFVRLEQAPYNRLRELGGATAYAALIASCADLPWDDVLHESTCRAVARLASEVRVARLRCLPDEAAARLSLSLMDVSDI